MELIVTAFLAIGLIFLGHLSLVIGHHFERPKRRVSLFPHAPLSPPPPPSPKRSPHLCTSPSAAVPA
jgi:hypothetical protein